MSVDFVTFILHINSYIALKLDYGALPTIKWAKCCDAGFLGILSKGERSEPLRYIHNESCCSDAISSQMAAPGRPILAGWAEGMWEMAL